MFSLYLEYCLACYEIEMEFLTIVPVMCISGQLSKFKIAYSSNFISAEKFILVHKVTLLNYFSPAFADLCQLRWV